MQLPRPDRNPICCHGVLLSAPAKIPWLNMHGWRHCVERKLGLELAFRQLSKTVAISEQTRSYWIKILWHSVTVIPQQNQMKIPPLRSVGSAGKSWWVERGTSLAPTDENHGLQAQGGHLAWPILHGGIWRLFLGALIHDWQVYLNDFKCIMKV